MRTKFVSFPFLNAKCYLTGKSKVIEYHCEPIEGKDMNQRRYRFFVIVFSALLMLPGHTVFAQDAEENDATTSEEQAAPEQDDVSKALDSTATQWSFQFAYQWMTWKDDLVNGEPNPGKP
jgi:hypothetical protein